MKEIIEVNVSARKAEILKLKTDLLCIGHFTNTKKLSGNAGAINRKLGGAVEQVLKLGDFKGRQDTCALLYTNGRIGAKRIMLVGLGDKKKVNLNTIRNAAAFAANKAVGISAKSIALALHQEMPAETYTTAAAQALAEGAFFGGYRYDEYVTGNKNGRKSKLNVAVIDSDAEKVTELKTGAVTGSAIGQAQSFARTLANRPANVVFPAELAKQAKAVAAESPNLSCTIFDEKQLMQKKMGGIIAVGQGSSHPPRMIVLKYEPKTKTKNIKTVALVGKAITFDSGGISIKPSANMDQMKMDMTGGAVVLATVKAIAELQLPINVTAIICSAENAPSGDSYRPGDIITTYSGKTVEILNTDAEGRMVLCDGIHYANELKCEPIVDIATLTGACMVGLGTHKAGLMANDDELIEQLKKASDVSGEAVWHMPSGDEYTEEMKSKIADLKNIGTRWGGACSAASFLGEFAGKTKWAHLDIAGKTDPAEPQKKFTTGGSIGFGVRLFVAYLRNLLEIV